MSQLKDIEEMILDEDFASIKEYIEQCDKSEVNKQNEKGDTSLHIATEHIRQLLLKGDSITDGLKDIVLYLAKNLDVNIRNNAKCLAVHSLFNTAREHCDCLLPLFDALLNEQNVNEACYLQYRGDEKENYLSRQIQKENWDVIRLVLRKGLDINVALSHKREFTALDFVTFCESDDVPEDIIKRFSSAETINRFNGSKFTPLMTAAVRGKSNMVLQLIENGAEITSRDEEGRTALLEGLIG